MLPNNVVSSDATMIDIGTFFNLIGVSIEFDDYNSFRKKYCETLETLKEKYNADNLPSIIKKKTLSKYIPSFSQRDFLNELITELLTPDDINFVQVTETFFNKGVDTYKGYVSPKDFMKKILFQYYPLVPIWKYINNAGSSAAKSFVIDNIDGKITKIWSFIGTFSNHLHLVPYGDQTYPSIAFCDTLCEHIRREVFPIRANEIFSYFKENYPSVEVRADFVGDKEAEELRPKYPYTITPQNHYPHPIIFIANSGVNTPARLNKVIIEESPMFNFFLNYAGEHEGCVTFLDIVNHQRIFRGNDIIVCIDDETKEEIDDVLRLDVSSGVKSFTLEEGYSYLRGE